MPKQDPFTGGSGSGSTSKAEKPVKEKVVPDRDRYSPELKPPKIPSDNYGPKLIDPPATDKNLGLTLRDKSEKPANPLGLTLGNAKIDTKGYDKYLRDKHEPKAGPGAPKKDTGPEVSFNVSPPLIPVSIPLGTKEDYKISIPLTVNKLIEKILKNKLKMDFKMGPSADVEFGWGESGYTLGLKGGVDVPFGLAGASGGFTLNLSDLSKSEIGVSGKYLGVEGEVKADAGKIKDIGAEYVGESGRLP